MRTLRTTLSVVIAILLTAALAAGTVALDAGLRRAGSIEATPWQLTALTVDGTLTDVPENVTSTLLLLDGEATGTGACNSFFARYTLSGDTLRFGPIGTTRVACPEPSGSVEASYLAALETVATFTLEGETLTLVDADGATVATYQPLAQSGIEGAWIVTGYAGADGGLSTPLADTELTAIFGIDGSLAGSAGCNRFTGSYATTDGGGLAVGPLASTLMLCAEDLASQEQQYLASLGASVAFSVGRDSLTLTDAAGATTVTFDAIDSLAFLGDWVSTGIGDGAGALPRPWTASRRPSRWGRMAPPRHHGLQRVRRALHGGRHHHRHRPAGDHARRLHGRRGVLAGEAASSPRWRPPRAGARTARASSRWWTPRAPHRVFLRADLVPVATPTPTRHAHRQAHGRANGEADAVPDPQAHGQADRHAQAHGEADREADPQVAHPQADREAHRQADPQADAQADRVAQPADRHGLDPREAQRHASADRGAHHRGLHRGRDDRPGGLQRLHREYSLSGKEGFTMKGEISKTSKVCSDEADAAEARYLKNLKKVTIWRFDDANPPSRLTLRDKDGSVKIVFDCDPFECPLPK